MRSGLVGLAWAVVSCGSPTDDGPPAVSRVVVNSPVSQLPIGETTQLSVRLEDASGRLLTGRDVDWSSSNNTLATVSSTGLVSGQAAGSVTITAKSEGRTGGAGLTIFVDQCTEASPIAINQPVAGQLAPTDCRLDDGTWADRWLLTLNASTDVQIDMASDDFDAFLWLQTADGTLIAYDDDAANGRDPRLDTTLAAGTYVVTANAFAVGEVGAYTLSVASTSPSHCAIAGTIALGESVAGSLTSTDCVLGDGTYTDGWEFTVSSITGIAAALTSGDFDAFVVVTDAQGNRLGYDDDSGPGTNSRLRLTLNPGTYYVWANTFYAAQAGAYTLSLTRDACNSATPLSLGETGTGELAADDCRLSDGSFADRWLLTLGSAATVRLDLTSDAFDPYLLVTDADGEVVATDDDGGTGTDARIDAPLPAGTYVVWANTYAAAQTGAYSVSAATAAPAALNLRIDGLYVTQAIQRFAGTVPLVKNRPAYLRVFGRANISNTVAPTVRVRVYNGAVLQRTLIVPRATASVPTVLGEGTLGFSWNVLLDAADVQPGLAIDAEIDPTGAVAESDETDNSYPASGTPRAIDVRSVPRFDLTLVPVHQSANGLIGDVTTGNAGTYLELARSVFPFDAVDVSVRAAYTTTLPALQAQDANGAWGRLLAEINALRLAESAGRTYYGVVKVGYPNGQGGLGYLGVPAAIGVDASSVRNFVTAHELGHTFGRFHSPCGGAGGPDPDYPHENGAIGVFGYNATASVLFPRTTPDVMSYCTPAWISDYTYEGVLSFRAGAAPALGVEAARPVLLVWGTVDDGRVILEPAFHILARPSLPRKAGPWTLVARDADDRVLFSHAFDVTAVGDAKRSSAAFAFALPVDSLLAGRIHSLRVSGPSGEARLGLDAATRGAPPVGTIPVRTQRSGDRLRMTWDRQAFPAALLRDTRTGRILSILRNGELSTRSDPGLELLLSDGVRTTRQRVDDR